MLRAVRNIAIIFAVGFVVTAILWNNRSFPVDSSVSPPLTYTTISTDQGPELLIVKAKITNSGTRHIRSCQVTCIAVDASGKELDFDTHYAIASIEGGLPPQQSVYQEYFFEQVRLPEIDHFEYQPKGLRY